MEKIAIVMIMFILVISTTFATGKQDIPPEISSSNLWDEEFIPTAEDVSIQWNILLNKLAEKHLNMSLIDDEFSYKGKMNILIKGRSYAGFIYETKKIILKFGSSPSVYYVVSIDDKTSMLKLIKIKNGEEINIPESLKNNYLYVLLEFFNKPIQAEMSTIEMLKDLRKGGFI